MFFCVEILLKSFASNSMYLYDIINSGDAFIVVLSFVFNLMNFTQTKILGVVRLARVIVIVIRKITGNTSKLRHQNKLRNPVESVINIMTQIKEAPESSASVRKEITWAINLIESNKLYASNFDLSNEQQSMDMDAKEWLNKTTEQINDTSRWFERDLDDFLKEIHRENEEDDPSK